MKRTIKKPLIQFAIFIVACFMFMWSCGYYNIALFAWIYPALFLIFFRNINKHLTVIAAGIVLMVLSYYKYKGVLGSENGDIILCGITFAVLFIPLLIDRWLYRPIKNKYGVLSIFLFPIVYGAISVLEKNYIGMGRLISFTQTDNSSLIQCASIIGTSGLIILICLCSTTIVYCIENFIEKKNWKKPLVIYFSFLIVVISLGSANLTINKTLGDDVIKIGMAQTSQNVDFTTEDDGADLEHDINYIKNEAKMASDGKAKLLTFGEEAFFIAYEEKESILNASCEAAKQNNIYLVITLETLPPKNGVETKETNELYFISDQGNIIGHYIKSNLMPQLEDNTLIKGDGKILTVDMPYNENKNVTLSFVLCYDADLQLFLTTCDDSTQIIIVPSWGWDLINPYHTNVMRMRAIENGMPIVNPAINVKSSAIDWQGNNIAISDSTLTKFDYVTFADVPFSNSPHGTIYRVIAPYIMWILFMLSIIFIILGITLYIRYKSNLK